MKKIFLLLPILISHHQLQAQPGQPHQFGVSVITTFDAQPDSTVYSAMQQFMNAGQPVSYVSLPMVGMHTKSIERVGPLVLGEGQNGYILEGITDLNFILMQGRRQQSHFGQTSRFSFRYAPGLRMTEDNSSNLLPTNQKVGFQYEKVLWDNYTNNFIIGKSGSTAFKEELNFFSARKPFHSLSFAFLIMHYSNGQPEGSYRSVDSARNDYIKGDFSTNLLQPSLTYHYYSKSRHLLSANFGYQRDLNLGGPFAFLDVQKNRYGQHRLLGWLQWRSAPSNKHWLGITKNVRDRKGADRKINLPWEWRVRWEYEYIMGNMSQYKRSKDYRFNWHLFLEGQPLRSRTIGYMLHLYRGRDYFNIRYDDIVWVAHLGFTFTINRYHNPRFHPDETIKGAGDVPKIYQRKDKRKK